MNSELAATEGTPASAQPGMQVRTRGETWVSPGLTGFVARKRRAFGLDVGGIASEPRTTKALWEDVDFAEKFLATPTWVLTS